MRGTLITEGKTKVLREFDSTTITMTNKDSITIGDGEHMWEIPGKGILATAVTANVFKLLEGANVRTHFIAQDSPDTIRILPAEMYKVEVVDRNSAEGSYLERNPTVKRGTVFDHPIVELFFKSDAMHDPYIHLNERGILELHKAHEPLGKAYIRDLAEEDLNLSREDYETIVPMAQKSFKVVRDAFLAHEYDIPDGKFEIGRLANGFLAICDVYDFESFRMRDPEGNEISKQVLRDLVKARIKITDGILRQVLANYAEIAAVSSRLQLPKAA